MSLNNRRILITMSSLYYNIVQRLQRTREMNINQRYIHLTITTQIHLKNSPPKVNKSYYTYVHGTGLGIVQI